MLSFIERMRAMRIGHPLVIYFTLILLFFITESVKESNGKVLVHCHAGISRSSTICMAYLMATQKFRMEEAYEFVKTRRRCVSPNFNFMEQLLSFENHVFQSEGEEDEEVDTDHTADRK